ncbi:MAG: transposase [Candidatus Vogelbacteria bacterium]|nr:transposase [Candidatus Vogelbacteria bacterium]
MERKFKFNEDEFYHIYNRGTDKRSIFLDHDDYRYFQKLLYMCNSAKRIILRDLPRGIDVYSVKRENTVVDIGAYCLMPNHFHLLLFERKDGGISTFMNKLSTAYAVYFNKKYKRTGGLFEDSFKAVYVVEDGYLEYLFSYIHLNPIKLIQSDWKIKGIKNLKEARAYLDEHNYSSYQDYLGNVRKENSILQKSNFPEYFHGIQDFKKITDDWLNYATQFNVDGTILISTQGNLV